MSKHLPGPDIEVTFSPANDPATADPPLAPLEERSTVLAAGSVHAEGARPLDTDIRVEYDVAIPVRTGAVLRADVYRPVGDEPVPAIVMYGPYGKRGGPWNANYYITRFGVDGGVVSGLQSFESLDPGYWVPRGYAIVQVDAAGTGSSSGDEVFMGTPSGRNAADAIDWVGEQEWCTGKVGMAGNSQLAMIQWFAAAERPAHLAAIAPWEGLIDVYRDSFVRGGIPDVKFHRDDIVAQVFGSEEAEDLVAMLDEHPLLDAYWQDKRAAVERIEVPAYVVASWTSYIHPRGTLQGFRELPPENRWLRVHNTQEWVDIADLDRLADLQRFFDRYLRGVENGWEQTPRVRYSVLDPAGSDVVDLEASEWPLPGQGLRTLHLDAGARSLSEAATDAATARYDGATGSVRFTLDLDDDLDIVGYPSIHLWVAAEEADDLDLFAALYLESAAGERQNHIVFPAPQMRGFISSLSRDGVLPGTMSYSGPLGRLRVSHRALDADASTPSEPVLTHAAEEPVTPGVPVAVELGLWPTALRAHAGQRLVLEIAGHPVGPYKFADLPGGDADLATRNRGAHVILTGGEHDSFVTLPVR